MSFKLLKCLVTRSRVVVVSMEIFGDNDSGSGKEDGSFLRDGEFVLNCGVPSDKGFAFLEFVFV